MTAPAHASVLDLFERTCSPASDMGKIEKVALAAGWEAFTPSPASGVGKLLAIGKAATADQNVSMKSLRLNFQGDELALVLVRVELDGAWVNGCRLYGPTVDSAPSEAEISKRLERGPIQMGTDMGMATATWEPGWVKSDDSLELVVVPLSSEAAHVTGFAGWALVGQAVSAPKQ